MATTRKHYTDVERHLFLNILKKYRHIIENKKNDSATLKDKDEAWREINEEYNSSSVISTERTVKQLKKWWSNLKTDSKDALTSERQSRVTTGGGPPIPIADVDPEIKKIASKEVGHSGLDWLPYIFAHPALTTRALTLLSSNISKDEIEKRRNAVLDNDYLEEYLTEKSDSEIDDNNVLNSSTAEPETINVKQCLKSTAKVDLTDIDDMPKIKSKKCNRQEKSEENELKLERIRRIIQHEEKLAAAKLQHEIKKQKIEIEYLQQKNSLEIRAATASAALAELLLQEARKKCE